MSQRQGFASRKNVGVAPGPTRYRTNPVTENPNDSAGEVALVGAGPGDPELLTIKAWRLITSAEVVLYDRLVSPEILSLIPETAERVHVGKQRANHALPQDQINQRLVDLAREGRKVVRLKGGDPFIFGRGGEEIETLAAAGVRFQVVPGITAASGCAAYSGIPLTHRDHAQSVRFVTGHLKNNTCDLPWKDFVQTNQTLVFYMGLVGLPIICKQLMGHGMSPDMPVALVSKGTTPEQVVVTGTLANIVARVQAHKVHPPTLVIIGQVVSLRSKLDWVGGVPELADEQPV
ncbi:uroporphyrinogen-III C-methyltransferase [Marinobacter salinisoli]|uniref:uroporphyrinogen-III C-methyltransferase n=1 Tax=Marinobacter salinisoli TaxID=2769486 RepID=A0ABX7MNG7_9GAMM|nr:uroporphyrinogen-III C-methyltransferase [Marinobacter salinisoli]